MILLLLPCLPLFPQTTIRWTGGPFGLWNTAANWRDELGFQNVPNTQNEEAVIDSAATVIMNIPGCTIGRLIMNNANAVVTLNGSLTAANTGLFPGDCTISAGRINLNGRTIAINGDLSIGAGGRLNASPAGSGITLGGDWSNSGTFNPGVNTVRMNGDGSIANAETFSNLRVDAGARACATGFTVTGSLAVNGGSLSCTAGAVDAGSLALNGGDMTISAPASLEVANDFLISDNASACSGTGALTVAGGLSVSAGSLANDALLSVGGGLAVSGGELTGTGDIEAGGSVSLSGTGVLYGNSRTIMVKGDWDNASGAGFDAGTASTVAFIDNSTASTISGDTAFYSLECTAAGKTILFAAGSAQTVNGAFTITGAADNLVRLRSTADDVPWRISNAGGAESVAFAFVRDSTVDGANNIVAASSRNESGNDTLTPGGWVFSASDIVWIGNIGNTDWNDPANWDWGYVPNTTDNVFVGSPAPSYPLLAENTTISDLTITGVASVGTNNRDFAITGDLTVSSAPGLAASGAETIAVNGSVDFSDAGNNFSQAQSDFVFRGPADAALDAPEETFYDFTVEKTATGDTVRLLSDLVVSNELAITSGTLDAQSVTITLSGGLWSNSGEFTSTGSRVVLTGSNTRILGSTTFFDLSCDVAGAVIAFQNEGGLGYLQTVEGDFNIIGTESANITLTSISAGAAGSFPPVDPDQWRIDVQGAAAIELATIEKGYAVAPVTPNVNCTDGGSNYNWFFIIRIISSWTLDTNNNGRIDRIRVLVQAGARLNDGTFDPSDLAAAVEGYAVTGFGSAGNSPDDVFDIYLREGVREDSDAVLRWRLTRNSPPGLYGTAGGAVVQSGPTPYTTSDGARPVISYTLAAAGSTYAYIHFSEPVSADAGGTAQIGFGSLDYSDGGNPVQAIAPIEISGTAAHAAMLRLQNPLAVDDVLPAAAESVSAATARIWGAAAAVDPGGYANTNWDDNLPANAARAVLNGATAPAVPSHAVSDVGLNLIAPVFAYDLTVSRDVVRGGIGKLSVFDGTGWMRPRDTLLEARLAGGSGSVAVHWDVSPADPVLLGKLWIPQNATSLFPVQTGTLPAAPLPPPDGSDRYHNANPQARSAPQSSASGALRDFTIPGNDSEFANGAVLQFMFTIEEAGSIMPCAYVADIDDPATAAPWSCTLRELELQRADVTITNNVINPDLGETADLHYLISQAGRVTITVFDLKGDVVDILFNGIKAAGEHTTSWNGKNRGGRPVTRGIYFMRAVGSGFDEFRKVLVVR